MKYRYFWFVFHWSSKRKTIVRYDDESELYDKFGQIYMYNKEELEREMNGELGEEIIP